MAKEGSQQWAVIELKVQVPFYGYDSEAKNRLARKKIREFIKRFLIKNCSNVDLYVGGTKKTTGPISYKIKSHSGVADE